MDSTLHTYYVGYLLSASPEDMKDHAAAPRVDMSPVPNLITSTIAVGTWGGKRQSENGFIAAFQPGLGLMIRHEPRVHEQVTALMRNLRRILDRRGAELGRGSFPIFTETYAVDDLLGPGLRSDKAKSQDVSAALCALIKSAVAPGAWGEGEGVVPSLHFNSDDRVLVVSHNRDVLNQVEGVLRNLRRLQETQGFILRENLDLKVKPVPR